MNPTLITNKCCYAQFEGGSVYTAESDACFVVIIDESTCLDLLSEDERADIPVHSVIEFTTEKERTLYLNRRFGRLAGQSFK